MMTGQLAINFINLEAILLYLILSLAGCGDALIQTTGVILEALCRTNNPHQAMFKHVKIRATGQQTKHGIQKVRSSSLLGSTIISSEYGSS